MSIRHIFRMVRHLYLRTDVYDFRIFVCMKTTRTNIVLNDDLIDEIIQMGEAKTKKEAVENALRMYVNWLKRQRLAGLRGKIEWEGDLMKMRKSRF